MSAAKINKQQRDRLHAFEKLTQASPTEAATLLGVSYSTYSKWRTGQRDMHPSARRCLHYARFILDNNLQLPIIKNTD